MLEVDFKTIEKKWQDRWQSAKLFEADDNSKKPKYYVLEMFPYPSGSGLHMGHAWNYTIGDILARFKLMNGFNVLHPMGYDSLGLPAENAAIKNNTHPREYTGASIKNYISQQKNLGLSYDWSRILKTSSPEYYRWDQWIFLKMFEKGLAYQKESNVNWCPSCKTVLANEQAQTGKCERCNTKVSIKRLTQWFLKITDYADELYEEINNLDGWPDRTKAMQRNWIGKSHGTEIDFEINGNCWSVFTTRPDTIFGVTFMVVSAQHKDLMKLVTPEQKEEVINFLNKLNSVSEKDLANLEKEGVFTGSYAINPATNEKIPVYAGNFVVADYGAGMVMAVPAHDQRDFEFAKKYGIEIKQVITNKDPLDFKNNFNGEKAFTKNGLLMDSKQFSGLESESAKDKISEWLIGDKKARKVVNFKLRDWGISRQRYWGTPIPIIHCKTCGMVPVPEKDLPLELPRDVKFGEGNPLETAEDWITVKCPKCSGDARRETDTMDTFVNSSWYFLRYTDPNNSNEIFNPKKVEEWCPIDMYIGGAEHACMHLIYFRFYTKFLADLGLINFREPAKKLFHQGMLQGEGGIKMSKSKGNVVNPDVVSEKYGIDTARFFLSGLASPDKNIDWSEKGIVGSLRFINKIFKTFEKIKKGKSSEEFIIKLNESIGSITSFYQNFEYRKATIVLKELFDLISKQDEAGKKELEDSLKLLNPICPHITEELWESLGNGDFLSVSKWPEVDKLKLIKKDDEIPLKEKILSKLRLLIEKFPEREKIFIYVLPFEKDKLVEEEFSIELKKEIKIFSVKDCAKYDPQNKSKKARPGSPGVYLE